MICTCQCHIAPDITRAFAVAGVDVRGVVEAAVACRRCQNEHVTALLNTELPSESPIPRRGMLVTTPEGRQMSWDEYNAEMQKRADSWRHQGDGENCA